MKKAFTLAELLVSMTIITVILSVVLFNYGGFNDNLAISGAVQEMAVTMRQAQTYGISVKEAGSGTSQFNYAYGIYFSSVSGSNDRYIIFVDSNNNNKYDAGADVTVETVNLRNGVIISSICDATTCPATGTSILNVTFLRPNPDARIYFANSSNAIVSGPNTTGRVRLSSPKGKISYVIIENTGQIAVQ